MKRLIFISPALCALALTSFASDALAKKAPRDGETEQADVKRASAIMVPPFEGPRSKTIRDRVVRALEKDGVELVPEANSDAKLGADTNALVAAAKANGVRAFVRGKITMTKKAWTLSFDVRSGATGEVVGSDELSSSWLPGLLKAIDKEVANKVMALVDQVPVVDLSASEPEAAEEEPQDAAAMAEPPPDAGTSAQPSDAGNRRPPVFFLHVGPGVVMRSFSYTDPFLDTKRQELFPHSSPLLAVFAGGTWYPGAHFSDGLASYFGIRGHVIRSVFGSTSVTADKVPTGAPTAYPTVFQELEIGLRTRVPMGDWEIGLHFGVGSQQMGLAGDNVVVRLPYSTEDEPYPGVIPDIDSTYYRFGADVDFPWLGLDWMLGAGMRLPNFSEKPGALAHQRWFPNVVGNTATASLGVNIPVTAGFGLLVLGDFRQTGLDMNSSTSSIVPNPTEPGQNNLTSSIAGGATDRYVMLSLGLSWGTGAERPARPATPRDPEPDEEAEENSEEESEAHDTSNPAFFGEANSDTSSGKDTSDPSFFGAGAKGSGQAKGGRSKDAKDTSDPDFFK